MIRLRSLLFILLLCVLTLALPGSAALAAGAEGEHGGGHGAETYTFMGDWFPRIVNFGILAVFLVIVSRKPVRDFFKNRSEEIARSLRESKEARERAAAALADLERKMKDITAETNRVIDDARSRGEQDKQRLLAEGAKIVQDVQAQVKGAIEAEVQKAKTGLAVEASLLAVDLAERAVKEGIKKQDHERILKEYIDSVGGRQ